MFPGGYDPRDPAPNAPTPNAQQTAGGTVYDGETGEILTGSGSETEAASTVFDGAETQLIETQIWDFISMGQLVPSVDWITVNVCAKGKGTRQKVAELIGRCTDAMTTTTEHKGQMLESIKLDGEFEVFVLHDESTAKAPVAYLPKAWGRQVKQAIDSMRDPDGKLSPGANVQMILSLGVEATGKTIPYRWTVSLYTPANERPKDNLSQMRLALSRRGTPALRIAS